MTSPIPHEHEVRETVVEDVFYPDHPPRTESEVFRRTKEAGHKAGLRCAISGHPDKTEYHHFFLEWADADAVDWNVVKQVATGALKVLPVLDPHTDQPTGETYPVEQSLLWAICKLMELRGFDWQAFDPGHPEQFVDSPQNMMVLHEKFHRAKTHGIHMTTFPMWVFQAYPRVGHFIFSPDEESAAQS